MSNKKHPPNWVRHFRELNSMTAKELGEQVGLSKEGVTYIERQERGLSIPQAKKIADIFGVHYVEIIDGPTAFSLALTEQEDAILKTSRRLSEKDKDRVLKMAASWIDEDNA